MPLKLLTDRFTDATHQKLDADVNKRFPPDCNLFPGPPFNYATLLFTVLCFEDSEKFFDINLKYHELTASNEELQMMLASAWEQQSYRQIRNLAILCHSDSDSSLKPEALTDAAKKSLLFALTNRPYKGCAVDALYEYLQRNHRKFADRTSRRYYARFCSIVQSSGTGKTRTMLELARKGVLVLYMNLRPVADKSGFPLRDDIPASILTENIGCEMDYYKKCCAFFAAIFKLVYVHLSDRTSDGKVSVEDWNNDWHVRLSPRAGPFARLKSAYDEISRDIDDAMVIDKTSDRSKSADDFATRCMTDNYSRMTDLFSSAFPGVASDEPKLVIALDEAHPLQVLKDFRPSTVLFRVIKSYSGTSVSHAVWVIFASTTSKVAHFASPQTLFDSARVSVQGELLFPPFSELGWDHYAPWLGAVPPSEVAKAEHILCYGRPLWFSMKHTTFDQMFDFAAQKLGGSSQYDATNPRQALAVLAQRFGLDICFGHHDAVDYVETSVASHLRVCITTTDDRLWSYTTYPSEPLLSCAATYLLHNTADSLKQTLAMLVTKVGNGMIDIGQRGELVSRLLWLLAKDLFVLRTYRNRDTFVKGDGFQAELIHCQMIPVIAFFEFVFGDSFWSECSHVKDAFEDAYINFSHWVSMDANIRQQEREGRPLEQLALDEWTLRHWQRTSAVQCCHNQPLIDKIIPIYFTSGDPENRMSQILISDKDRLSTDSSDLSSIARTHDSIGGPTCSPHPRPYIAILADLGRRTDGFKSITFPKKSSPRLGNDMACLRIHPLGFSTKTYPFLQDFPAVFNMLEILVRRQGIPNSEEPYLQSMRDQVRYGVLARHDT